jgi:hypothetical protein
VPSDGDEIITGEKFKRLAAEVKHDSGLRHMEDRGVKYEDSTERKLDHDQERGMHQHQEGASPMADTAARYNSPPESIALARQAMRTIKEAITKDADGNFPAKYAETDWDGLNMWPPETAWQDMDADARVALLQHALREAIWSLEPSPTGAEPHDYEKLGKEFVEAEERADSAAHHEAGQKEFTRPKPDGAMPEETKLARPPDRPTGQSDYDKTLAESAERGKHQKPGKDKHRTR